MADKNVSGRRVPALPERVDLLVIGGGINGCGIARDAAGRGLSVLLCEKDDLAEHTSSASTKLIHGGLRYLEHFEFPLVRSSLQEREVLLKIAPHIIWPLRFVLPYHKALRPRWILRSGLLLYDHIGGRKRLPKSKGIDLHKHPSGDSLKAGFQYAFEYSDCWVQDARLVVLNARDAADRGALVRTHTRCTGLDRNGKVWQAQLKNDLAGTLHTVEARSVVNATGPWVEAVLHLSHSDRSKNRVRLVKGSHIVVPKLFDHPYSYVLQHTDSRVLFVIPFERDFTLLGTTDVDFTGNPQRIVIAPEEVHYICSVVNRYLEKPVAPDDVVWSYSGVRPLLDDASPNASRVTRDYQLQMDDRDPPLLSVFGGKITTYRKLAEEVIDRLARRLPIDKPAWTADRALPGGAIKDADFEGFLEDCKKRYRWFDRQVLNDYARNYGSEIERILDSCGAMQDLGEHFGGGLYEREVRHLMVREWARTAEDVLWRRTKKGLRLSPTETQRLESWLAQHQPILYS